MSNRRNEGGFSRRELIAAAGTLAGGALLTRGRAEAAQPSEANDPRAHSVAGGGGPSASARSMTPGVPNRDYHPVVVPNGAKLPWKVVDGVKVFHLVAEEVDHEFAPGLRARCWGYNGSVHGPLIEAVELDRVRIYVTNRLPASTTVHWHSILLPNGMDGVGGLNQKAIPPGETFKYEFTLHQSGTAMYHSHHDEMTQIALGMTGMFVIHPRRPHGPRIDRDFAILLHEWRVDAGARRPDPNEMTEFNVLTMNAKAFPGTDPLVVKRGQRVRVRIGNLSPMDHHPIHLHGYQFRITGTDGGDIPESAQWRDTTVLVPVGSTRTIEFVADEPGDWAFHCHMTHHVMNQMGHGLPNMVGVDVGDLDQRIRRLLPDYMSMGPQGMGEMAEMGMAVPENSIPMVGAAGPFGYIDMGGMFTLLKVREGITSYEDPGWYQQPKGTEVTTATAEELKHDGIEIPPAAATPATGSPAAPAAAPGGGMDHRPHR